MLPVPPHQYGGIERVIHMLITGLVARGHEVILFAHPESAVPCRLIPYGGKRADSLWHTLRNTTSVSRLLIERPDIIHSFGRLAYLAPLLPTRIPKIMSYQRNPTIRQVRRATALALRSSLSFTACSTHIAQRIAPFAPVSVVYNGVALDLYTPVYDVGPAAPLVFLGRIERIKGAHTAIRIARATGRRLVIAGNIVDTDEGRRYYATEIAPALGDGMIDYVGPVDDAQKNVLLGSAAALLMPVEWEEPFGIVMAEALACGTPVVGYRRGAVPEIIEHGVTGFVCDTQAEMIAFTQRLAAIDRRACRRECATRFSARVIVDDYERLYRERVTVS